MPRRNTSKKSRTMLPLKKGQTIKTSGKPGSSAPSGAEDKEEIRRMGGGKVTDRGIKR